MEDPSKAFALSEPTEEGQIRFADLFQALRRRRRLALTVFIVTLLVGGLNTAWERAYRPVYEGSFRLLVKDPIEEDRVGAPSDLASVALQPGAPANTSTLIQVLTSPLLLNPIERRLGLGEGALARLSVSQPPGATPQDGVLLVTLRWADPAQGLDILREVSKNYLSYSLRHRQEKLNQGLAFLDQQAPELQARVASLQNRLAVFRQSNGFVEPESQASTIKGQQEALSTNLKQLEQEQAKISGLIKAVQRGQSASALPQGMSTSSQGTSTYPQGMSGSARDLPPAEGTDGTRSGGPVTGLLQDLIQVEKQLAEAQAIYTEEAPQIRELRAKRDRLRPLLRRRELDTLQTQFSQNQTQIDEIRRQQALLARRFLVSPIQMKQYEALQQQLEVARNNLTSYIKTRENFRLQVAQRTVPWSVLAPAQFGPIPVQPDVKRGLMLSALLGALAGVGLALLRDRLDHVFHTPRELNESLAMPLLGLVPYLPRSMGMTISQSLEGLPGGERFAIRESLRNLFANFRLLRADKAPRLVAITSSTQGEGKTTTAAMFAQTLAQLGKRVLLVDADMRLPMLHRYIGTDNDRGLSSLLTDANLDIADVVKAMQPGLDLITAGPVPPDPTQLLSSDRCAVVVDMIRKLPGYDLVIFDTPPALLLSDPVLMAEHLDGLLFLVGLSRVNRDMPAQAIQRVRDTGVDVLGVLANQPARVSFLGKRYSYGYNYGQAYGYGYSYGYGYGYGSRSTYGDYAKASIRPQGENGNEDKVPETIEVDSKGVAEIDSRRSSKKHSRQSPLKSVYRRMMNWFDER